MADGFWASEWCVDHVGMYQECRSIVEFSNDQQEWHHQLRSSLHPALFAIVYFVADKAMSLISFFPQFRAMILAVLPNLVQAYFAAAGDYYTWQFAERLYGTGTKVSGAVVSLHPVLYSSGPMLIVPSFG